MVQSTDSSSFSSQKLPQLPATRESFDELYKVQNDPEPTRFWRDEYYGLNTPFIKRCELVGEKTQSMPFVHTNEQATNGQASTEEEAEVQLAKSWIRVSSIIIVLHDPFAFMLKFVTGKYTHLPGVIQTGIGQRNVDAARRRLPRYGIEGAKNHTNCDACQ